MSVVVLILACPSRFEIVILSNPPKYKRLAFLKSVLYNNKALLKEVNIAEWSSPVARRAHNPKVVGSNPASATMFT